MDVKRNGWFFLFRTLISSGIVRGYLFHLRFMRGLFQEPQLHPPLPLPIAIVPASVFTTSLLYWRKPLYDSWYRVLDITTVLSGVTYQSIYAFQTIRITSPNHHFAAYTAGIMLSAACYVLSNILMSRSRVWPATYAHASIHIVANIANLILYHGNI